MENAKGRLSRLLTKERSNRGNTEESKYDESKIEQVKVDGIDTSPLTSPENLAETRRRLSRLLSKDKGNNEDRTGHLSAKLFSSTMGMSSEEGRRRAAKAETYHNDSATTPIRVRKRVTIEERQSNLEDMSPNQNLNRISKRVLTRSRSLSPLPSRNRQPQLLSHYTEQHSTQVQVHVNQEDSLFQLDFQSFQDADCKLVSRFSSLRDCGDRVQLHLEVSSAASVLSPVGVAHARFWELDDSEGTNSTLSTVFADGSVATLNAFQSDLVLDFSRDAMQTFGANNPDMLLNPQNVCTWLPSHPAYQAVRKIASHGHSGRGCPEAAPLQQEAHGAAWMAIHAIKIICHCPDSARHGKALGVLLITEAADPSLPFTSAYGNRDQNMLKLRRYMVLQLLQKLALAVENRVSMFQAQEAHSELVRYVEDASVVLGQRETEVNSKDDVIASREEELLHRDMRAQCSESLVECANLLSQGLVHSVSIASTVAKSGCVRDLSGALQSNCWVLFQETRGYSHSSSPQYTSALRPVCGIAGRVRGGSSSVMLQFPSQNQLIERLLYGDHSAQTMAMQTVSKSDLHEAGLRVVDLVSPAEQEAVRYTVAYSPMQLKLADSLGFDCPRHCTVQAVVVVVTSWAGHPDVFANHVASLARLTQRAFEGYALQTEEALQQRLATVSSVFYDSVTTTRPIPPSDSFSPSKSRGGERAASDPVHPPRFRPFYEQALTSLLNAVGSTSTAAKLGVRHAVLLVSDVFAAHLKLCPPPSESRKITFKAVDGEGLQSVHCPVIDLAATSWLQDLYSGKIVHFDSAEAAAASASSLPEAFNVDQSLRGAVSKQSKLVSPPYWESQQLLRTLVQSIDTQVAHCALIPIRTAAGLSVLVLVDKLSNSDASGSSSQEEVIPFSASYMSALLSAGVCKDLTNAMVIVHQQSAAYWAERELSLEIQACETREERLAAVVDSGRARSEMAVNFARWKCAAQQRSSESRVVRNQALLNAALQLMTHRNRETSGSDCRLSFTATLETQLKALFPMDSIAIADNRSEVTNASVQFTEEDSMWTLHRDVATTAYQPAPPAGIYTSSSQKALQVRGSSLSVRISRPVQLNRPFSQGDVEEFSAFCSLAEDIFAALSKGHRNDFSPGDARSLISPLLQELLPELLSASTGQQGLQKLLPLLVKWLKRLCDADMVVLRLRGLSETETDTLLSSEDLGDNQLSMLTSQLAKLSELVQLELASAAESEQEAGRVDNISIKLLDQPDEGVASLPLGELRIIASSGKKTFTAEHCAVAQLLSYVLTFCLRGSRAKTKEQQQNTQLLKERQQLQQAVQLSKQAMQAEAQSSEAFKARLASILSVIMFTDRIAAAASLQDLAALVCDGIPKLVGVSSAVLLLRSREESGTAGTLGAFNVIMPRSSKPSDSLDASAHQTAASSAMTVQQLQQVPQIFESVASAQCRVDLLSPQDDSIFGSVLLFRTPLASSEGASSRSHSDTFALWEGLEDILRNALSSAIHQCTARVRGVEQTDTLNRALQKANAIIHDQANLEPDIANLLSIKHDLEVQRDGLQEQVSELKDQVEEVLSDKARKLQSLEQDIEQVKARSKEAGVRWAEEVKTLQENLAVQLNEKSKLEASKNNILELVSSFSFDQRCEADTVVLWLRDVAESTPCSLQLVAKNASGVLQGAEGVRGVMAAVAEAVRTGMTVEFTSATFASSPASAVARQGHLPTTTAMRYFRSDGRAADSTQLSFDATATVGAKRRADSQSDAAEEPELYAVLCVPNRCAPVHRDTEHACFVFMKPVKTRDEAFTAQEKDLLNCAANLASRTLMQTTAQLTQQEMRRVEEEMQRAQHAEDNLRRLFALCDALRQREYQSMGEVSVGVSLGIKDLLTRGERDACVVESTVWLPPWNAATDRVAGVVHGSEAARSADLDALTKVLGTGQRMRRRSVCWLPVLFGRGNILAVVRAERRFSEHTEQAHDVSPVSSVDGEALALPTIAHLALSDVEEELLVMYVSAAAPLFERMDFIDDAYSGVHQAGQAILALQTVKQAVEEKYALEVAHRLQLEESLKVGAEMLGMTAATAVGTAHLLDTARKSVLAFTSSLDCFIIMPAVPSSVGSAVAQEATSYCTFTSDLPREVAVLFEAGDLESAAMQNYRSIKFSGDSVEAAANGIGAAGSRAWQSWAVRRVQSQTNYGMELGSVEALDSKDVFTLAVPFALRSGAVAVISVVRRTAPFTGMDRECITWVSKVLAYCLSVKGGEETMVETVQQVRALQGELVRLQEIDQKLSVVEEGRSSLERTLTSGRFVSPLLRKADSFRGHATVGADLLEQDALHTIVGAVQSAFGPESVEDSWLAAPTKMPKLSRPSAKTVVTGEAGSVSYWVEPELTAEDLELVSESPSLGIRDTENAADTRMRLRRLRSDVTMQSLSADDLSTTAGTAVIYLHVQAHGFPTAWIKLSATDEALHHAKLRVAILLRLLHSAEPWRSKVLEVHQDLTEAQRARAEEKQHLMAELQRKMEEIEHMKESFVSNLGGTKDKYKTIVTEKSTNYRKCEKIFTETMLHTQTLRQSLVTAEKHMTRSSMRVTVVDALFQFARSLETTSGLKIAVGECSSVAPVPLDAAHSRSSPPRTTRNATVKWLSQSAEQKHLDAADTVSPIQIALSTGKAVLFLPETARNPNSPDSTGAVAVVRDSLLAVSRRFNGDAQCVLVNPSEGFPVFTMIIPVLLPEVDSTVVFVLRPTEAAEDASKYVLSAMLASTLSMSQACADAVNRCAKKLSLLSKCQKLALKGLKNAALKPELARTTQALFFEKLRSNRLVAQLDGTGAVHTALSTARAQVSHLEQLNADWTEMVKGITGASGGIQSGITGLWSQACPTLMDLLSSQVRLKGCGLLMQVDSGDEGVALSDSIVEYTVRELSTPFTTDHLGRRRRTPAFSPIEGEDYSRGALECRPASDLGATVRNLAQDILTGRTGNQRIFKLTRSRSSGAEEDASLWLVPIRTARTVLGVLRVSIDMSLPEDAEPGLARRPHSPARSALATSVRGVFQVSDLETTALRGRDQQKEPVLTKEERLAEALRQEAEVLEAAQSNLINFAEVLAPLQYAAQLLEKSKRRATELEQESVQATTQVKTAAQEVSAHARRSAMLAGAVKAMGTLCKSEIVLPYAPAEECLRIYCNRLAIELSQYLSGRVVIHIFRDILGGLEANEGEPGKLSERAEVTAGSLTEVLLDPKGRAFGRVSISFEKGSPEAGTAAPATRKLYAGSSKAEAHASNVAFVLPPLSAALSGYLLRTARELSAKAEITAATERVQSLESALQQEQEAVMALQRAQEERVFHHDVYRGLADVLNHCLVYCSSDHEERLKYPGNGETYTFSPCVGLQETLSHLCVSLPALVGNSCSFSFALLDSKQADTQKKSVTWVRASADSDISMLDWHKLSADARETVMGLAHTCISKRSRTVRDLSVDLEDSHISTDATAVKQLTPVRVVSYPLMDQNSSVVLGVVQCLLPPSCMDSKMENLCQDVSNSVSCMLSVEVHLQRLCCRTQMQKLDLLTMEEKASDLLRLKEMWLYRCTAWKGLCLLAATLSQRCAAGDRFVDVLSSEAVVGILSDTGVRISLRPGSLGESQRQMLSTGARTLLAHAVLPVTDSGDIVAEIACERQAVLSGLPGENDGIATMAAELVETVTDIIRSARAVHKARMQENVSEKVAELQTALYAANAETVRLGREVQEHVHRFDALRSGTSGALQKVCRDAATEISSQIEAMSAQLGGTAGEGAAGLEEVSRSVASLKLSLDTAGYYRVGSSSDGFGEAKLPETALGSAAEADEIASALIAPVSGLLSSLRAALTRIADLQKAPPPVESKREDTPKQHVSIVSRETAQQIEHTLQQLSRARKVHRVVCREASALLDPPYGPSSSREAQQGIHPASLSPLAASRDCCLKLLAMVRTLLRSEGQALLLRDPGTDPVTYQVMYTGDSLHWAGIEQGTFGVVSSTSGFVSSNGILRTSLAETAMHTRKTLQASNAPLDPRYYAYIDGICDLGTPILMVPMRGRGGTIVGVLVVARGKNASSFTAEDIVAAEICSALGALSLYWCQGMGSLHHQLVQSANKSARLERLVEKLQEKIHD